MAKMSRRCYIEAGGLGRQQFVSLKRSRSYGHHHHKHLHHLDHLWDHHHHHPYDEVKYYKVGVDEWNTLKERERVLDENNKTLVAENKSLRSSLSASQAEAHRLEHVVLVQVQSQLSVVYDDNQGLRKSLDKAAESVAKHHAEAERLQDKNEKMEKDLKDARDEISDLKSKIRHLTKDIDDRVCRICRGVTEIRKDVDYWRGQSRDHWKAKWEDLKRRHDQLIELLDSRTERMKAYEEILKRRSII